ncbi:hypothetical protein BaRGS_00024668, partial [Batillaria attramentaria]
LAPAKDAKASGRRDGKSAAKTDPHKTLHWQIMSCFYRLNPFTAPRDVVVRRTCTDKHKLDSFPPACLESPS